MESTTPATFNTESRIRRQVRAMLGRKYMPGERLPPIKTLARLLGTGQTNTQRAVKSLVAEGLLIARPSIGTIVCDGVKPVEQSHAPSTIVGRSVSILHGSTDQLVIRAGDLLRRSLGRAGAKCSTAPFSTGSFASVFEQCAESDAIVLVNPPLAHPIHTPPTQALLVLSAAAQVHISNESSYDFIGVDSRQGAWQAGRQMRELGVDSVCYVGVGKASDSFDALSMLRLEGFEQGWGAMIAREHQIARSYYMPSEGAIAAAEYARMSPRPEGVFCATDDLAVGFVMAAHAFGLRFARDYQLIGFDGQMRGRELIDGPLTTVDIPLRDMVAIGAQWLIERLTDLARPPRQLLMGCRLYNGVTTRDASHA